MIDNPGTMTDTIVEAIRLSGVRAIISAGWSGIGRDRTDLGKDIFLLDEDCPHGKPAEGSHFKS